MSIEAMSKAYEALNKSRPFDADNARMQRDAMDALRTAIQQAEANTDEPVAWLYIEDGEVMFGHPNGYRPPDARPLVFGDTHPAPGVPDDVVRDAERYRWLADCNNYEVGLSILIDPNLTEHALGEAIDAAMTASQAQKGQQ